VVRVFASHWDGPRLSLVRGKNFYLWLDCPCNFVAKPLQLFSFCTNLGKYWKKNTGIVVETILHTKSSCWFSTFKNWLLLLSISSTQQPWCCSLYSHIPFFLSNSQIPYCIPTSWSSLLFLCIPTFSLILLIHPVSHKILFNSATASIYFPLPSSFLPLLSMYSLVPTVE
jgi:hypothetical protein